MNKYFHNLVLGVSVLPALLIMPALAEMEVVQGNGTPVDVLKGTMDQKSDGGRIWLKDFTKGVYTYDAENHTLLLEADDNGQIELSSFSASIQSTNPDHNYPSVTVKGDPNTTITMIGQQGENRDWSIFSRFAPLYVGSEDSPIGLLNVENSTGKGGAIYVTSGNSSFRAEDQDLQIYANDVSLKVNGNSAAITGNEGKLTLVANDTLNIYGNIEGYNNVYGGHADMTLNINQNEGNTAKTIIVGDINSAKGSSVNIGLKGTGSSIMGNLLVSANGTTLPGGKIKLDFGKQGKITGNITAQDAGTVVINADTNVDINGNISVTANSEFSGKNINLTSTSGTALLSKGADANVTLVGDTNIIAQTVGVRGGNGGSLNIGDTDSSVSIYAKNDDAVEAFYDNSIVNIGGKKVSLHTDATGNAAGIWAQNSTTDTDKTPATVNITADDIEIFAPGAHGVVAMSQGIINLNGNTTIKAKEKAILARGDAQVHINKDTDNTLKMEGDIDFDYDKATSGSKVDAIVDDFHVLHIIGHQIRHCFVVGLCRESERAVGHTETIVESPNEMKGALALDVVVQCYDGLAIAGGGITHFFIERSLIVKSCAKAEYHILVKGRNSSNGDAWRHDGFFVVAPVGEPHTIVQCEVPRLFALRPEAVGVLEIALQSGRRNGVLGDQRIYQVQSVGTVGDGVSAGVSHFVFPRVLADFFPFHGESGFNVVLLHLVVQHQLQALYVGFQVVAGMFHIGSHPQLFLCLCVVQPVLSHDVEGFLFLGVECRPQQRQLRLFREGALDSERAEECAEDILLLSVEIHLESLYVLHRAK